MQRWLDFKDSIRWIRLKANEKHSRHMIVYNKQQSQKQLFVLPRTSKFAKYPRRKRIDPRLRDPQRIPFGRDERRTQSACAFTEFRGAYQEWKATTPLPLQMERDPKRCEKSELDSFDSDFMVQSECDSLENLD